MEPIEHLPKGVFYNPPRNHGIRSATFTSTCYMGRNKKITKSFSVNKYGYEEALRLAKLARKDCKDFSLEKLCV